MNNTVTVKSSAARFRACFAVLVAAFIGTQFFSTAHAIQHIDSEKYEECALCKPIEVSNAVLHEGEKVIVAPSTQLLRFYSESNFSPFPRAAFSARAPPLTQ